MRFSKKAHTTFGLIYIFWGLLLSGLFSAACFAGSLSSSFLLLFFHFFPRFFFLWSLSLPCFVVLCCLLGAQCAVLAGFKAVISNVIEARVFSHESGEVRQLDVLLKKKSELVYWFVGSLVRWLVCSLVGWLVLFFGSLVGWFVCSLICLFVGSLIVLSVSWLVGSSVRWIVRLFVSSLIVLFVRWLVRLFVRVCLFVGSFVD